MDLYLWFLSFLGTLLAFATACAAYIRAGTTFSNNRILRKVLALDAEVADTVEKLEHLTKLFKKMSARYGQRERRAAEKGSGNGADMSSLEGEDWKNAWRKQNIEKIALNQRR